MVWLNDVKKTNKQTLFIFENKQEQKPNIQSYNT